MSDASKTSQETIFAEALARPPDEREAFVDRACADDRATAAHVKDLLRGYEENSGFLEAPPASALGPVFESALAADAPETAGARIGPYKLLQEIGEGGFGTVWMAEQQEPIRRRVALKIIKLGMDTREVIARFEAERQALALMDHPNIARVFDAGATDAGRPYFAMELVRGIPITRYCDENRLAPEARLHLFIAICHAVQHAHQKGVIHRDLKPSNILVTMHDGVPVPKVIDFGIAKATSAHLTDKTLFTQFHAFIGTPAYTSPEQMEMSGLDVDTRSDIYSLGVLLYELLTGRPPFDPDTLAKSGLEAMRRTIREVDPPRPSARLATLSQADRTSVAHERGIEAAKLSLLLRGDLDWVVMHALEKDRTRRYDTPAALAADIQRHLASEPVLARPPGSAYRLRKFIRRHKVGFFAAAAVAVSLVAGLIVSSVSLVRERVARSRAVAAERAEGDLRRQAETARVEEVKRAAQTALDLANQNLTDGRVAEGLAYLVYAGRKNPLDPTLAPRLASTLTSHNFLLPEGAPFDCDSQVMTTRFSADGRTFLVGTADGTLRRFDTASGKMTREFRLGQPVKPFGGWQFARANDEVFAARFQDGTLVVFDAETGRPFASPIALAPDVFIDPALPTIAGLSPDGRWAYACSRSQFCLWDAATGERRIKFRSPDPRRDSFCDFSNDGRRLVVTDGGAVHLWSLPECKLVADPAEVSGAPLPPRAGFLIRFSADSRRFALYQSSTAIHLFDATTGTRLKPPLAYDEFVYPMLWDFAPDGRLLLIGGRTCRLWDLDTGAITTVPLASRGYFEEHAFNRDGATLLTTTADGFTRLWDTATGALLAEPALHLGSQFHAALSPDGGRILIGSASGLVYRLRLARNVARPLVLPRGQPAMPAPFLPESPARLLWFTRDHAEVLDVATGRMGTGGFVYPKPVAVVPPGLGSSQSPLRADLKFLVVCDASGAWEAWELASNEVRRVVPLADVPANAGPVVFSPVEDRVAIVAGSVIRMWDLRTGEGVGPPIEYGQVIAGGSVNFSLDGRRLGLGGESGLASIWDVATGRRLTTFQPLPEVWVTDVRLSPDGDRVVTMDRAGQGRLWDAATGAPLSPVLYHADAGQGAVFSPDGRRFATRTYAELRFWDAETRAPAAPPIVNMPARQMYLSTDSTRLLVAGDTGDAQLWDVHTGRPLTEPMHHGPVSLPQAAFSPDGRFIRTETTERNFCVWSIPPPQIEERAIPEWLLQLATICAGKLVNDAGQLVDATDAVAKIDVLRQEIAALSAEAPFADWGRWVLDDRPERSIAPGFTITPAGADELTAHFAARAAAPRP